METFDEWFKRVHFDDWTPHIYGNRSYADYHHSHMEDMRDYLTEQVRLMAAGLDKLTDK